jgi:predicted small secreted protein
MTRTLALWPLLALLATAACETVEGAGRDLQTAGEVITDEAQETQAGY